MLLPAEPTFLSAADEGASRPRHPFRTLISGMISLRVDCSGFSILTVGLPAMVPLRQTYAAQLPTEPLQRAVIRDHVAEDAPGRDAQARVAIQGGLRQELLNVLVLDVRQDKALLHGKA